MAVEQALAAGRLRKKPQVRGLGGHLRGGVVDAPVRAPRPWQRGLTVEETSGPDTGPADDGRPGLLDGVTVIDLGQIYNAPYATLLLAQAGARVIKVEPPGGERNRKRAQSQVSGAGLPFLMLNANKLGVTLNLKLPEGRRAAAGDGGAGRRVGGELPARRDGAARPRARGPARPAPVPDLCVEARASAGTVRTGLSPPWT